MRKPRHAIALVASLSFGVVLNVSAQQVIKAPPLPPLPPVPSSQFSLPTITPPKAPAGGSGGSTATSSPSIGPATHPSCDGPVSKVYVPTPICGHNDAGAANPALYEQHPQWNGSSCVMARQFVECSGEP